MDNETLRRIQHEYLDNRIRSAHPVEIVTMLYQVAIDNLHAAIEHLRTKDRFSRSGAVTKAQEAVHELSVALDHSVDAPFVRTLADLYRYVTQRIGTGHAGQSEEAFREALAVLTPLAVAWQEVKARVCYTSAADTAQDEVHEPVQETRSMITNPYGAYGAGQAVAAAGRDWSC